MRPQCHKNFRDIYSKHSSVWIEPYSTLRRDDTDKDNVHLENYSHSSIDSLLNNNSNIEDKKVRQTSQPSTAIYCHSEL